MKKDNSKSTTTSVQGLALEFFPLHMMTLSLVVSVSLLEYEGVKKPRLFNIGHHSSLVMILGIILVAK